MARPRSFDDDDTLEAIRTQFWETGYAATSVDDLIRATGLGKGSLYGAFGSKHDMFVRSLSDYTAAGVARYRAALDGDDAGALSRLRSCLRAAAKDCRSERGCMVAKAIAELAGRDDDVDAILVRFVKSMEETIERCIRAAQRAGDVPAGTDTRQLALTLFAVLRGMESLGRAGASVASLRSIADGALAVLPLSA